MRIQPTQLNIKDSAWALAAVGLLLAFFARLAFTSLILARGDAFLYFYPYWDYRAQSLLAGHLPLWNPDLFMGAPFLANPQAGVLYPLNWPLIFFNAPLAFKLSILLHLGLAMLGAQAFARRQLNLSPLAALLAAAVFGLGGYLTAQVEHINQLQTLAWFPWLLLALGQLNGRWPQALAAPAGLLALMLLAGHTQSVFICLAGAAAYTLPGATRWRALAGLALAGALAGALAAAQLLPTLELSAQSLRSGGLPLREALSFSLDPRLLGRALLPGYSRALFSEFIAYPGLAALALAALSLRRGPRPWGLWLLTGLGLAAALGAFNPLYAVLAALPPLNLFRVPARWLFLFAFGLAMLAGLGLDRAAAERWGPPDRWRAAVRWGLPLSLPLLLMALSGLSRGLTPAGETGPLPPPALADWVGWCAALALAGGLLAARLPAAAQRLALTAVVLVELYAAAQSLPYNHPTAPEAYSSIRPAMTQLLAAPPAPTAPAASDAPPASLGPTPNLVSTVVSLAGRAPLFQPAPAPMARFLSMSALRFDPGDLAELRGEWGPQLDERAVYDLIVATKNKEVLSPNLPLTWGLPTVDGFDGGILPLRRYAAFTRLFTGQTASDGRLRENLTTAPPARLLSLVNARYLIADKVNDAWIDGVFYDRQFSLRLAAGERFSLPYLPRFETSAVRLLSDAPSGAAELTLADGQRLTLAPLAADNRLPRPATPVALTLIGPLTISGLSLVDERAGVFQSLSLGPYRLAHSGDVKIYENLEVLPRAFVVPRALAADDEPALALLADPAFDPAGAVILADGPAASYATPPGAAAVSLYSPERIVLTASGPGYLVLTDADYPGWTARLDGQPAPIRRADVMFRAVELPPGQHTLEFRFEPRSLTFGLACSAAALVMLAGIWFWPPFSNRRQHP